MKFTVRRLSPLPAKRSRFRSLSATFSPQLHAARGLHATAPERAGRCFGTQDRGAAQPSEPPAAAAAPAAGPAAAPSRPAARRRRAYRPGPCRQLRAEGPHWAGRRQRALIGPGAAASRSHWRVCAAIALSLVPARRKRCRWEVLPSVCPTLAPAAACPR